MVKEVDMQIKKQIIHEIRDLELEMGFEYMKCEGKMIYVCVVTNPDIGYAIIMLTQHSTNPHKCYFVALN